MLRGVFVLKSSMYMSCCPLNQRCPLVGLSTNGGFTVHVHNNNENVGFQWVHVS